MTSLAKHTEMQYLIVHVYALQLVFTIFFILTQGSKISELASDPLFTNLSTKTRDRVVHTFRTQNYHEQSYTPLTNI